MHAKLALTTALKATPQLILTGQLLQVSGVDIEQLIFQKLTQNPALEMVNEHEHTAQHQRERAFQTDQHPRNSYSYSRRRSSTNSSQETPDALINLAVQMSAIDQLIAQVRLMVEPRYLDIAVFLLHSLDNHGYLRALPSALAAKFDTTTESVEHVIQILHQLEPPGIGARSLRECLLIQCAHLESDGTDCHIARRMIAESWEDVIGHCWQRIARCLDITTQDIDHARQLIFQHFYPYPLLLVKDSMAENEAYNYPDLIIHREAENSPISYKIEIPESEAFELRINASFQNALQGNLGANLSIEERTWTYNSIEQARMFIAALNQRWVTLRRISEYLVAYQIGFLERGPLYIKPLTRTAVARELNLHESTIARAIQNKIVQLPNGRLIPLSQFFDDSLAPKEAMRQLLTRASEPLSDREIASQLEDAGFNLARRTITKYRQQLHILPFHQRQSEGLLSGL